MGLFDSAKDKMQDMKDGMQGKMDDTTIDDKAKQKLEDMQRKHSEESDIM